MLSILICSINEVYLSQVRDDISQKVGVEYEILVWDNRAENKGICEVYNLLASRAAYDILLFLHEDTLFETKDWGRQILEFFDSNSRAGVLGVAGSKYKSRSLSGWFTGIPAFDCANIVHRYAHGDQHALLQPVKTNAIEEVVCVDGVFICARKTVWEKIRFDEENIRGFHFYDIDFSTRASGICSVFVTYGILINHITKGGDFGNKWVEASLDYHCMQEKILPLNAGVQIPAGTEMMICKTWLDVLKHYKISWKNKWRWIRRQRLFGKPVLYYPILKFLLYRPLGLKSLHKPRP